MDEIFDIIASFCIPRLQKWIVRGSRPTSSLTFLTPSIKRCRLFPTCLKREQGIEPPVFIAGKLVYGKMVIKLYMPRCWSSLDQGQTRFQHSSAAYLQTHLPMPINQIVVSVITTVVFRFGRILVRSISIFITVCVAMGFGMLCFSHDTNSSFQEEPELPPKLNPREPGFTPICRDRDFVESGDLLDKTHRQIFTAPKWHTRIAFSGLGGVG